MKRLVLLILAVGLISPLSSVLAAQPLVVYNFYEGNGDVVHDVSGVAPALDLTIANPGNISWIDGGLAFKKETIAISAGPATKVIDACMASDEITVEVWHKPANETQGEPRRIVSISRDGGNRNMSFIQHRDAHHIRLRTTTTGFNGNKDVVQAPGLRPDVMVKAIYSRDKEENGRLYVGGEELAAGKVGGNLSNWDAAYKIMLGNEETVGSGRFWLGEIYYVAIYSEALTPDQVLPPGTFLSVEPGGKLAMTWGGIKVK